MVKEETIKFIAGLRTVYPNSYKDLDKTQLAVLIDLWTEDFATIPYGVVMLAFSQYRNSNKSGFPPVASQLKEIISKMSSEENLSPNEAYGKVYKAICNSSYYDNAIEEYNKLPSTIQKVVSVDRLMQLAKSEDNASLVTFEASFKREYEKALQDKKDFEALPLKNQQNILKIRNLTKDMFNNVVLGNKENIQLENK